MDVSVCVGTFGADEWWQQGHERAKKTREKFAVPVCHVHDKTLHEARNGAVSEVTTEWVCVLDADDELEHGYFDHMERATADVRVPQVRYMHNRFDQGIRMPRVAGHDHDCTADCLAYGNWIVIGAVVRTELLKRIGFRDFPIYEDYDVWARCWKAGATFETVPLAVYRAHVRTDSRNRGASQQVKNDVHTAIARANGLVEPHAAFH